MSAPQESSQFSRRQFLQAAAALSATAAESQAAKSATRPNIVFLTADEYRHDALGCAGNPAIQTPNLDRLAGQGCRFARTYCQGPLCQPSRASLITGQYVHQHGITWNGMDMKPEWPTMMEQLQQAGYVTAKVGKTHFVESLLRQPGDLREGNAVIRRFGLDWLLEEYDRSIHLPPRNKTPYTEYLRSKQLFEGYHAEIAAVLRRGSDIRLRYSGRISAVSQEHTQTAFVADQAIDWLRGYRQDKPFFLWVSFVQPHPPLFDDARWAAHYKNATLPLGPGVPPPLPGNAYGRYLRDWIRMTGTATLTPEVRTEAARHYYGAVSLVDQKIGDIVRAIDERGWGNDTWFFFTADHGEMLGDHKFMFKNVFYKGSVLVPNIVYPAGGAPARTVAGPVESIDITATIVDVAGAKLPQCQGRSLAALVHGQGAPREVAYSELAGHRNEGNYFVMAATEQYRYLYDKANNLPCELFDLENDPDELHNLVDEPAYAGLRKDLHKDYVLPFLKT